jgi:hypothetical protein
MALSPEDLAQVVAAVQAGMPASAPEPTENKGTVNPENDLSGAPWFYVHLSDGSVIQTQDSGSTHIQNPADPAETLEVVTRHQIMKEGR